ncbi:MAG: energy transducer TonB [Thermoanaerobaculaceae bacterium]
MVQLGTRTPPRCCGGSATHWQIPEIAQLGVGGVVRIHFFIERDGRVTGLEIEMHSAHPPMDFAARDAILNASPLPPLPADLVGVEREGVTITFYYNTPVPEGEYTRLSPPSARSVES